MRPGFTISTAFHAVILGWGLIHFASVKPMEAPPVESLPIDLVSISEITKSKQGNLKAEKKPEPEKQVEKKAEPKEKVDPNLPVKDREVKSTPPPTPSEQAAKKEEPKKEEQSKPDPKPAEDAIAKKLEEQKKIDKKKEEPKKVVKEKAPPVKTKHKFDPDRIAELLDRRAPSRKANTGETKQQSNLGTPKGNDQTLSMSELDAFRRQVEKCWNVLPGAGNLDRSRVELRITLNPDGTLASQPQIYRAATGSNAQATSESAVRAVITCGPYKMFRPQTYASWKDMIVGFEPNSSSY